MTKSKDLDKQIVIPYSKEAVDKLLKVEREHNFIFGQKCYTCPPGIYAYERRLEPCEVLVFARKSATRETRIAVALIRSGEGRGNE